MISFIIVRNPYLDFRHLDLLVSSLNQQICKDFNTFWIDQTEQPERLAQLLQTQAQFEYNLLHVLPPKVGGVPCWYLTQPFTTCLAHPAMGQSFVYLHMECLPEVSFVDGLVKLWPQIQARYGARFIAHLQQVWCCLSIADLADEIFLEQLRLSEMYAWNRESSYVFPQRIQPDWNPVSGWQENAFWMPTALARETGLYAAPERPLYFQDVFDIFRYLETRPYWQDIQYVEIPHAIIYHLYHGRAYKEYQRDFLMAIQQHPDMFKGFSVFDVDWQPEFHYEETDEIRQGARYTKFLKLFYSTFRHDLNGTNHHWLQALDRWHEYTPTEPFYSPFF